MKTLVLRNASNTVRVEYKVDMSNANSENFTIMEIVDLDAAEETLGLDFKQLPSNLQAFKEFATENHLILELVDINPTVGRTTLITASRLLALTVTNDADEAIEGAIVKIGSTTLGETDANGQVQVSIPITETILIIGAEGYITEDFEVVAGTEAVVGDVELETYPA